MRYQIAAAIVLGFRSKEVRLQLHGLVYDMANFVGASALPDCAISVVSNTPADHPKPPNRGIWPCFRPVLDCATVLGG